MNNRNPKILKLTSSSILTVAVVIMLVTSGLTFDKVNKNNFGVAIKGYDTVAYHTEGVPVLGESEYSHKWNDAVWFFSSSKNRDLFAADPEKYAPQYGGY